jgi:Mrp family chromosome partitioning ATPase
MSKVETASFVERRAAELAVWSSPAPTDALVLRPLPAIIGLEYVTLPDALDERLVMLREPESARARSYRLLRHRLLSDSDPRIVAVTSARPGEGKTTCALNLAFALAEDTLMSVLLLEANLRRPAIGKILGFEPIASLVEDIARFTDVGPPYPVGAILGTRLHVAALPQSSLPEARLDRTQFSVALLELRQVYDYIVIDAASVLESADADVIGECSSGVVMTTRARTSRTTDLRRAIDQLVPATILGTVLLDA